MRLKIILPIILILILFIAGCVKESPVDDDSDEDDTTDDIDDSDDSDEDKDCRIVEETYTEEVPYNETEYYYVKEGVGREYCEDVPYTDIDVEINHLGNTCDVVVTNTGDVSGDWTIVMKFITTSGGGGPESEPMTKELFPGDTVRFRFEYDDDREVRGCRHIVEAAPIVSKCHYSFYEDVRKSRIITKYRDVEKTRTKEVCD